MLIVASKTLQPIRLEGEASTPACPASITMISCILSIKKYLGSYFSYFSQDGCVVIFRPSLQGLILKAGFQVVTVCNKSSKAIQRQGNCFVSSCMTKAKSSPGKSNTK